MVGCQAYCMDADMWQEWGHVVGWGHVAGCGGM